MRFGREAGGTSLGGMATAAKAAAARKISGAIGLGAAADRGRDAAWRSMTGQGSKSADAGAAASDAAPAWARRLRAEQAARHHRQMAIHMLGAGSSRGAGATPDIKERD